MVATTMTTTTTTITIAGSSVLVLLLQLQLVMLVVCRPTAAAAAAFPSRLSLLRPPLASLSDDGTSRMQRQQQQHRQQQRRRFLPLLLYSSSSAAPVESSPRDTAGSIKRSSRNRRRCRLLPEALSGCAVVLTEPTTGCTVLLLGCVHGSPSSAADVELALRGPRGPAGGEAARDTNDSSNNDNNRTNNTAAENDDAERSDVDVVVLELCPPRFRDLTAATRDRDSRADERHSNNNIIEDGAEDGAEVNVRNGDGEYDECADDRRPPGAAAAAAAAKPPWIIRYGAMVRATAARQGGAAGGAAALLGAAAGLQQQSAGLFRRFGPAAGTAPPRTQPQPGLEFVTATRLCAARNIPIVLADQAVDTTLQRLGALPQIAGQLCRDCCTATLRTTTTASSSPWQATFGVEADALHTALWGGQGHSGQNSRTSRIPGVTLPTFLTRNRAAVQDVLRMTLAPLLVLQVLYAAVSHATLHLLPTALPLVVTAAAAAVDSATADTTAAAAAMAVEDDPAAAMATAVATLAANAALVGVAYAMVALPAVRVVIRERDDVLAAGIRAACALASSARDDRHHCHSRESGEGEGGVVVAILGVLHVNGVAQRLLEETEQKRGE